MGRQAIIAVGAGVASALLFIISATASLVAVALAYLTPLPIMIAALGFRHATRILAAVVAASTVGATLGVFPGLTYLAVLGLPAWWLSYLALLARPGENGTSDWYPVSRLILWTAALSALPVIVIGILLVVRYGGYDALVAAMASRLGAALYGARLPGGLNYEELVRIAPIAVAASTFMMLGFNLWLSARVVLTSQRLVRPWPSLADGIRLPRRSGVLFLVLVAAAFLPDPSGLVAAIAAAALAMAFVFEGLAAAHVVTRGLTARRLILSAIYATVLFLMPWPLLALAVIGCLDSLFALRGRLPGRPPSPQPHTGAEPMDVILLERVAKLGQMGERVRVRDGFARNFLLPRGKALRATEANAKRFEGQRAQLEARNLELKRDASDLSTRLDGKSFTMIRQAGETGQLYGSVSTRDIAEAIASGGVTVARNQVILTAPIKAIGLHSVPIQLHPEVEVKVTVNVARSPEEAERQAKGEEVLGREETSLDELGLEVGAALAESNDERGER